MEVLVFYGSRTHFQYGYSPHPDSDLDILSFETQDATSDADLFSLPEIRVHWRRAIVPSVEAILARPEFSFPNSQKEDVEMHRSARDRAGSHLVFPGDWKDEWAKIIERRNPLTIEARLRAGHDRFSFGPAATQCALGKESVIFLREGSGVQTQLTRLTQLGFVHVGVVTDSRQGIEIP